MDDHLGLAQNYGYPFLVSPLRMTFFGGLCWGLAV